MTPQELERLGIAITGSTEWIAPLADLMGFREASAVRKWWTGKTKITATKQRRLYLLAGQPDRTLSPVSGQTRNRLARIMAMREQEYTYESIGQQIGISRQAVQDLVTRYRLVKPGAELCKLQCPVCSETFQPKRRRQVCCSRRCGNAKWRLLNHPPIALSPKPCLQCGGSFQPTQPTAKYCSRRCRNNYRARRFRQRQKAKAAA